MVRPLTLPSCLILVCFSSQGVRLRSMVQALAQAMLDAARAVPGFVQLDSTESNR